jgi:hypothetical protein
MLLRGCALFLHGRPQIASALTFLQHIPAAGLSNIADKVITEGPVSGGSNTGDFRSSGILASRAPTQLQSSAVNIQAAADHDVNTQQTQEERERQWEAWDEEGEEMCCSQQLVCLHAQQKCWAGSCYLLASC